MTRQEIIDILDGNLSDVDKVRKLLRANVLCRAGYLECLARLVERAMAACALKPDSRSVAVVNALRGDSVTTEIVVSALLAWYSAARSARSDVAAADEAAIAAELAEHGNRVSLEAETVALAGLSRIGGPEECSARLSDIREMLISEDH